MKTIDTKGKSCPIPLIMTKKALAELAENETLEILLDNEISMKNVVHFLGEHNMNVKEEIFDDGFRLVVSKTGVIPEDAKIDEYCDINSQMTGNYVMSIQRNHMGEGSDELGENFIKSAINTILELEQKPNKMIFLNSGILMTLKDSHVIDSLKKLEQIGVEILVCGACLDYYNKKDELAVGRISNMYDILDAMSKAVKVISL